MEKRYSEHYAIPASQCLIVPVKVFGEDASCDVRWQDDAGEMHAMHTTMFTVSNLMPLDQLRDVDLAEMFKHYYSSQGHGL